MVIFKFFEYERMIKYDSKYQQPNHLNREGRYASSTEQLDDWIIAAF
jgi:hypothetical protein